MNKYFKIAILLYIIIEVVRCIGFAQHAHAGMGWDSGDCYSALSGNPTSVTCGTGHATCRTTEPAPEYRAPGDTTTPDYVSQAAVFGIPSIATRFILSRVEPTDPLNPSYSVAYQYCSCLNPLQLIFHEYATCVASWWDYHETTFSGNDIRDINSVNPDGGYGSKNVSVYRVCVRRIIKGETFPGNVYSQEDANSGLIGPDPNTGQMVNLDNKNKICAYYVNSLPEDCGSTAVSASGAVAGAIVGSAFGGVGATAGALVGSIVSSAICGKIAGSGPCKSPFFGWSDSFIGCVDEPLYPGPPILNIVMPSNLTPLVPANFSFPQATDPFYVTNLNLALTNVIAAGSTFDQPTVRLIVGSGASTLDLRYRFPGDNTPIDSKPICGSFSPTGLIPVIGTYCAFIETNAQGVTPDRVCACVSNDGVTCTNQVIGCSPRPTPKPSGVVFNLSAQTVNATDPFDVNYNNVDIVNNLFLPNVYPVLNIAFQAYYDADNDRVVSINNSCVKVRNTAIPANGSASCTDPNALSPLPLSVMIKEYYKNLSNPPLAATNTNFSVLTTSSPVDLPITSLDEGSVYGVTFTSMIPLFDNINRVQYTNLITDNDVSPSPNNPYVLNCSLSCHESANFNQCVKFWTTAQNYYNCSPQDLSCLVPTTGPICPCGPPPQQLTGANYLATQYFVPAGSRVYQGVCTNDGTGSQNNQISYQGQTMTFNNWSIASNTSPSIINRGINSSCSSSLGTGPSDPNALNVYCPGILYEDQFEDLNNSKICLRMQQPESWVLLANEIAPNNQALCAKPTKTCPAYNTPTVNSLYTSFPRPQRIPGSSLSAQVNGTCPDNFGLELWKQYSYVSTYPSSPNSYQPLTQGTFCSNQNSLTQSCSLTATISNLQFRQSTTPDGTISTSYLNDTKTLAVPASSLVNATQAQLNSFVTNFENQFATMNGYTVTMPSKSSYCANNASSISAPFTTTLDLSINFSGSPSGYWFTAVQVNGPAQYAFSTPNVLTVASTDIQNFINNSIADATTNKTFNYSYGYCFKGACSNSGSGTGTLPNIVNVVNSALSPTPPLTVNQVDQNNFSSQVSAFQAAISNAQAAACTNAYSNATSTTTNQTFTLSSAELTNVLSNSAITNAITNFNNCAVSLSNNCTNAYQIYQAAISSTGLQNFCDKVNQLQGTNLSCQTIYNTYKNYITDGNGNSIIGASAPLPYVDPNLVIPQVAALNAWTYNAPGNNPPGIMTNVPSDEYAYQWVNNSLIQNNSIDARVLVSANYVNELINNYIDPNSIITQTKSNNQITFIQGGNPTSTNSLILDMITKDFASRDIDITQLQYFFPQNLEIYAFNYYSPTNPGYTDTGLTYQYPLAYFINALSNYINAIYQNNLTFYQFKLNSAYQTPTRTCNYTNGVENISNHCVFKVGCPNIGYNTSITPTQLLPADFAQYCAWPTPATLSVSNLGLSFANLNGSINVTGFCVYDPGFANTPAAVTLYPQRSCNVTYIGKDPTGIDRFFEYWAPITISGDVQQCVANSGN